MSKKPVKTVGLPPQEAENRRLFGQSQLHRFVRVIAAGEHAIELSPQPGCRLSISYEIEEDTRA